MTTRKATRGRTEFTRLWLQTLEDRDNPAPIAYSIRSDGDNRLYSIDLGTGTFSAISPVAGASATERNIEALSFSPLNFKLYGIDDGTGDLVTVNIVTGLANKVAGTGIPLGSDPGMAFDALGNLYVANDNDGQAPNAKNQRGRLYKVDATTGATSVVGSLGRGLQGIAFASNGVLYGVDEVNNVLVTVNTTTGATTVVGKTGIFPNFPAGILGTAAADNGTAPDIGADIAFDNAGTLWGVDDDGGAFQLNKATGTGNITTSAFTLFESLAIPQFGAISPPSLPPPPIPLPPPAVAQPQPVTAASLASSILYTTPGAAYLVNPTTGAATPVSVPFNGVQANTAVADLTGDGSPDVVFVPGVGGGPVVIVTDGANGNVVRNFAAFDPSFRGGLSVATGDVTGDGRADIVVGILSGGGPVVRVFDGASGALVASFFAFDPSYQGGVTLAVGDVTGDGIADIIASTAGGGSEAKVEIIDGTKIGQAGAAGIALSSVLVGGAAFAPIPGFLGGVNVTLGNFDGDGVPDLAITPRSGGGALVFTYSGRTLAAGDFTRRTAFPATGFGSFLGGLSVTAFDTNGDGLDEIVVTPQFGGGPIVRGYNVLTGQLVLETTVGDGTSRAGGYVS